MSGINRLEGKVSFADGETLRANNDRDYHDAPRSKTAIMFQPLSLDASTVSELTEADLARAYAGRDVLLIELDAGRSAGDADSPAQPRFALIFADELENMDKAKVNGRIQVNGEWGTIRGIADSDEDSGRQAWKSFKGYVASGALFVASVCFVEFPPAGLFFGIAGAGVGAKTMAASPAQLDQNPAAGLEPPNASLPGIKGRGGSGR